jgi:hypothetical protein
MLPAENIFGKIDQPDVLKNVGSVEEGGLGNIINLVLKVMIIGAGLYALFNLVLAGYAFMSAGDDPKKMAGAWAKIWQTLLGLVLAVGAFVLAAIFGYLIFKDAGALLKPSIPTLQ